MVQQVDQLVHRQLTTDSFAVEPSVPSLAVVVGAVRMDVRYTDHEDAGHMVLVIHVASMWFTCNTL